MGTPKYLMNLRTFVLMSFLSIGVSHGTGFSISPVVFEFATSDRADVMTVTSSVDQRKAFELAVFTWTQVDGKDVRRDPDGRVDITGRTGKVVVRFGVEKR